MERDPRLLQLPDSPAIVDAFTRIKEMLQAQGLSSQEMASSTHQSQQPHNQSSPLLPPEPECVRVGSLRFAAASPPLSSPVSTPSSQSRHTPVTVQREEAPHTIDLDDDERQSIFCALLEEELRWKPWLIPEHEHSFRGTRLALGGPRSYQGLPPIAPPSSTPKKKRRARHRRSVSQTQIKWGGAFQDGAGSTVGEEVEQVNSFLSRAAITTKYMSKAGRTDMLTLLALGWNKRKVEQLGRTLSQRYLKIIRILREQVESLNATRNELGVDDDTLQQWVADVQKWAEESDQTDGSLGALQARIEELVVIIRVRTQSLYRQNDSNKRRHRIRKVILVEKKRLAAAVDDYNKLAEPTKQIVSSDALMQTDIWPWQSTSEPAADLRTKRKVFEKVMAVRRLREEEMILCREMRHHWTVLRMRSVVLGTISSDSSFVGMSEDAQKGLCSLVLKKQSELKAEMLKVKDVYKRILSHQPLLEMDSEEEEDIPDDATESDLSTSDED
ncbi:uncharacterized protein LOC143412371 [Maylandia zebra]|uniref:uncharacterized protein LOC143412371 n=1 Tax=Maylandia zebra TaxID=106582 RepID=UPI00403C6304